MSTPTSRTPTSQGTVPWPDAFAESYRAAGYWADLSLHSYLADAAQLQPDACAVVSGDVRLSYADLVERVDAAAEHLLDVGILPDDRILVQLPNDWHFIVLTLACFRVGIVPVMTLPAHRRHELTYLAEHAETVAIATTDSLRDFDHRALAVEVAGKVPSVRHLFIRNEPGGLDDILAPGTPGPDRAARLDALNPDPDSTALFLLSGGTTGLPKLIARTHNDYAYNVRATSEATGVTKDTVYLGTLPASHNFPLACPGVLGTLYAGGKVVMLPSPEPARAFATIEQEKVTLAAAVPAVAQRWIEYAHDSGHGPLASLQVLQVGGSRMPDELARQVRPELGATLQQVFGMAEGLINMTRLDDPDPVICTTQGRPVSEGDEVRIVNSDFEDVPDGVPGLILTRGPYTPRGYFRADQHNKLAFTPDGWYGSGDIVERRADGNLVVHGRDKDMINRGGEKISAEEVENHIYESEKVELAAAVSMPDPVLGERLCVYVTLKPGRTLTLDEIVTSFNAIGVAAFKVPDKLIIVDTIPLTKVGKIDKKALREDVAARL